VIVDWSAAGAPKTGRDSIWICVVDCHEGRGGAERLLENPPTRHAAKALLRRVLGDCFGRGERVLAGFDFPFGYPAGFAASLGLAGDQPWRSVWDEIASLVADDERNRNNRFEVGARFNERISGKRFPFWGCPAGRANEFLGPTHHRGHGTERLAEKRLIDTWMRGAQPCWKLAYTGSVGSQVLTGIPVVRALRDDPEWVGHARIWPFETGFARPDSVPPDQARIVFAEVWPSWWPIRAEPGEPKDKAQVRTVAGIFARQNRTGELARWLAGPPGLSAEQVRTIATEEAWTLGVMAPREQALRTRTPIVKSSSPAMGEGEGVRGTGPGVVAADPRPAAAVAPSSLEPGPGQALAGNAGEARYGYLRDPASIYRRSFALVREAANLGRFPAALRPLAVRLAHAAGDLSILDDLVWSRGAVGAGRRALRSGAPILADSTMVVAGITKALLPAGNSVICAISDPPVAALASELRTTRSAAAVELWRPDLAGAVVAIGNAPTALFHLLEIIALGVSPPALVLGFPVGFVGAAEAKEALIGFGRGLPFIALRGRRGGSALAAASVNALCAPQHPRALHGRGPAGPSRRNPVPDLPPLAGEGKAGVRAGERPKGLGKPPSSRDRLT
jgi:precorrin-8X/cobalt-precorrin-8 methylmutase